MKKIIALLLIFAFVKAGAQKTAPGNYTYIAQKYEWDAGVFKGLGLPAGAGPAAFISGQVPRAGASYYDSVGVDSGLYVYSGLAWRKMDAVGGITSLAVIGSTPNANGASISGVTLNLQPADSTFGGVVTTGTQRWRGAKTILDKFVVTRWDASVGYYGVTINHPFSSTATVNGLRIGWFGGTNFGYVQAKKADNTFLPLRIEGGAQVSESGGIDIKSYSAGLRLISVDSFTIDYGNPPTLDPTMLYGLNQYGGVWKIKLGDNLTLTDDTLKAVLGSGITINTLYNADDSLTSSRIVDMRSRSLQFINANLFRIEDETGTDQGTYDFNKGIDFVTYNTAKSLNIKSDVINGIILKGRNITTGDSVYIQVNDSLRSVFNNFVEVADSGNYYMQVINKTTGTHGKAWWPAGAGGATPGIDAVLAVGQTLTAANRIINTGAHNLTIQDSGGGSPLLVKSVGSLPLTLQWNSGTSNIALAALELQVKTSATAGNGIGTGIRFLTETSTGADRQSGEINATFVTATDATRKSEINILGTNSGTTETYANFQTGGIVRVNNNADSLATKAYARSVGGGGGSAQNLSYNAGTHAVDIDAGGTSAVIPLATSSANGLATPNQVTGSLGTSVDGMGSVVTIGSKGKITIPYNCTITEWYVVSDVSGSIVFDVKRAGTSIIGAGNKPTLSSGSSANAAVSGWTSTAITAGDIIEYNIDSAATLTHASLTLKIIK